MRRVIVLEQVAHEAGARIIDIADERGLAVQTIRLHAGEAVPSRLAAGDVLVVMGGPMGVGDVKDSRYPFLAAELGLIERVLADGGPVLGICLGSQLLAHAAGARVYRNTMVGPGGAQAPAPEVGWAPVMFHGLEREPVLAGLAPSEMMLHWHGDTFDLPRGAVHLASTETCRNQAFRLGDRAFGLQFHPEASADLVASWVEHDDGFMVGALGPDGGRRVLGEMPAVLPRYLRAGERLLRNLFDALLAPAPLAFEPRA